MYDKIILALSLEHGFAEQALETAKRLAGAGAEIIAVHVYVPPNASVSTYLDEDLVRKAYEDSERELNARVAGVPGVKSVMLKGHSSRTITEYAAKIGADAIIVGSHKPGLTDYFLGTTAARVVRHAPCAVVVLR